MQKRKEKENDPDNTEPPFDPSYMVPQDVDPVTGSMLSPRHPNGETLSAVDRKEVIDDLDHFSNWELSLVGEGESSYQKNALLWCIAGYTVFFTALLGIAIWVVSETFFFSEKMCFLTSCASCVRWSLDGTP